MSKSSFGIVGICGAVAATTLTITLCIVCMRVVIGTGNSINSNTIAQADPDDEANTIDAGVKKVEGNKNAASESNRSPKLIITVDPGDFSRAELEAQKRRQRILDEADRLIGSKTGTRHRKRLQKLSTFRHLSSEEKNRIWWEIAAVSKFRQDDVISYTLTTVKARLIGSRYNTSVLEVFNLFREGAEADWRTADPPPKPGDEENKEKKNPIRDSWNDQ